MERIVVDKLLPVKGDPRAVELIFADRDRRPIKARIQAVFDTGQALLLLEEMITPERPSTTLVLVDPDGTVILPEPSGRFRLNERRKQPRV